MSLTGHHQAHPSFHRLPSKTFSLFFSESTVSHAALLKLMRKIHDVGLVCISQERRGQLLSVFCLFVFEWLHCPAPLLLALIIIKVIIHLLPNYSLSKYILLLQYLIFSRIHIHANYVSWKVDLGIGWSNPKSFLKLYCFISRWPGNIKLTSNNWNLSYFK